MAIKEYNSNGRSLFAVQVIAYSKIFQGLKICKRKTQINRKDVAKKTEESLLQIAKKELIEKELLIRKQRIGGL